MRVVVQGLWHLGSVTAACLAAAGHDVIGLDEGDATVEALGHGRPPVSEPGLPELVKAGVKAGNLSFTTHAEDALAAAEVLWVTYDTPVDENDVADVDLVLRHVERVLAYVPNGGLVVVSSQLPVGSVAGLEAFAKSIGRGDLAFACSPENLRLGKAIAVFTNPDRVVVGVRSGNDAARFTRLMAPITSEILVMRTESAEMTKHAINSFLALSVAFANEIATVCEVTGADAREVAEGLKSEQRIGRKAYLEPGSAFAGGTLARDISFLSATGRRSGLDLQLILAVAASNDRHRRWPLDRLRSLIGDLRKKRVTILGLTYKPGTDTLRRSSSVELARALLADGAHVRAYDPAVRSVPAELNLELSMSLASAVADADAIVVGTEWPEFRLEDWPTLLGGKTKPVIVDANGFLSRTVAALPGVSYSSVGRVGGPVAARQP